MTVRNGRLLLGIPGPTTIPDEVLGAMHRPAIDIYTGPLVEITDRCLADLKRLFCTGGRPYIYASNGHGAWEAALTNTLSRGEKVLVLESGRFAIGWSEMAAMLGLEIERLPGGWRRAIDPDAVRERLAADRDGTIKAILMVQVDTASGVVNDIPAIRKAVDDAGHDALLMADCMASLGVMPFEMDAWGVDVAMAGSQKGLMMPPGLGFVAAGARAVAAHEHADLRTRYWDWTAREGDQHYQKYCGTPPEHLLFGLRQSLDMIFEEGLDNVHRRHRLLADAVRAAVSVWSEAGAMEFNIVVPAQRADSVTAILCREDIDATALLAHVERHCGVKLGNAIGDLAGKGLRIAHMGHINAPMILGALASLEVGLVARGILHGKGALQAAIESLGAALPSD